jgi:hypothetical protein
LEKELSGISAICAEIAMLIFAVRSNLIAYETKNSQIYLPVRPYFKIEFNKKNSCFDLYVELKNREK